MTRALRPAVATVLVSQGVKLGVACCEAVRHNPVCDVLSGLGSQTCGNKQTTETAVTPTWSQGVCSKAASWHANVYACHNLKQIHTMTQASPHTHITALSVLTSPSQPRQAHQSINHSKHDDQGACTGLVGQGVDLQGGFLLLQKSGLV